MGGLGGDLIQVSIFFFQRRHTKFYHEDTLRNPSAKKNPPPRNEHKRINIKITSTAITYHLGT